MSLAYAGEKDKVYIITSCVNIAVDLIDTAIDCAMYGMEQSIIEYQKKIKKEKEDFPAKYKNESDPQKKEDLKKAYEETIRKLNKEIIDIKVSMDALAISSLYITMGIFEVYNLVMAGFVMKKHGYKSVPPQVSIRSTGDVVIKAGKAKTLWSEKVDVGSPTVYADKWIDWIAFGAKAAKLVPKWIRGGTKIVQDGQNLNTNLNNLDKSLEGAKNEVNNKEDYYEKEIKKYQS